MLEAISFYIERLGARFVVVPRNVCPPIRWLKVGPDGCRQCAFVPRDVVLLLCSQVRVELAYFTDISGFCAYQLSKEWLL